MRWFDYIYYRLSKAYRKWDGRSGVTGLMGVTLTQALLVTEILILFLGAYYSRTEIENFPVKISHIAIGICVVLLVINTKRYYNNYNKFRFHWKEEEVSRSRVKGVLVFISLVIPFLIFYFLIEYY